MCGIAGFHLLNPKFVKKHNGVERLVDHLLLGIEHRGHDATGFVAATVDGKVVMDKAAKTATDFIKDREKIPVGVQTALLHTRLATQGPKEDHVNNHPVLFGSCFAVHNGHINNDDALFKEFDLTRTAAVDSVAIPAMVTNFGFDKIGEALGKLHGRMATALIDPVNNPGTLILAKGDGSPLVFIQNEHFIMWASEEKAIKEAWAEVLGTPPDTKKYENLKRGEILTVKDGVVTRSEYKVGVPFGFQSNKPANRSTVGNRPTPITRRIGQNGRSNALETETPQTVKDAKEAIRTFLKTEEAHARRWTKKDDYTRADFMDVEDINFKKWVQCVGCDDLVIAEDMRDTISWGRLCIDCHSVIILELQKNYRIQQDIEGDDDDTLAGTDIPRIHAVDRDTLEGWASRERTLHEETLQEMVKRCGSYYTATAIEFLVFLTTPEYTEYVGRAQRQLMDSLKDMYEETYQGVAEEAYAQGADVNPSLLGSEDSPQPHPLALPRGTSGEDLNWRFCHEHNAAYKIVDGCTKCFDEGGAVADGDACGVEAFADARELAESQGAERGVAPVADNVIDLPKCPDCKTYVLRRGNSCPVCDTTAERKGNSGAAPKPAETTGKCVKCGHKHRVILKQKSGHAISFCKKHYEKCWKAECKANANHILPSGERVCHVHVRKTTGALSDTTLIKRGVEILEVR